MPSYQLKERIKGPMANDEDWWRLVVNDATGQMHVEHEWSHVSISNFAQHDSGETHFTIDEFRASTEPSDAKRTLEEVLTAIGRA